MQISAFPITFCPPLYEIFLYENVLYEKVLYEIFLYEIFLYEIVLYEIFLYEIFLYEMSGYRVKSYETQYKNKEVAGLGSEESEDNMKCEDENDYGENFLKYFDLHCLTITNQPFPK